MRPTDLQTYKRNLFLKYNLFIYIIINRLYKICVVGRCRSERVFKAIFVGRCRTVKNRLVGRKNAQTYKKSPILTFVGRL